MRHEKTVSVSKIRLLWEPWKEDETPRKSPFSTMTYLNPGFGGPWDMLGIFFVNVIFITLQKKSFGTKNF